jgi:MYXO-CTERM domain-containing protein
MVLAAVGLGAAGSPARADLVDFTITNLQPAGGAFLTPVVFGAHDGSFTLFTPGQPASVALERIAEDGTTGPLVAALVAAGGTAGATTTGAIGPGQSATVRLDLNPASARFLTFATMVIPSNDAFIGNPTAIPLTDSAGRFVPVARTIFGSQVWDAGTEVNDEIPMNTAFFGQTVPNTGDPESGVVRLHGGFIGSFAQGGPAGPILSDPRFANADFTRPGVQLAELTVTPVPAPPAALLAAVGVVGLVARRGVRRRE